ncbi:MAG: flagellar motor switch protein FliG [Gammaproteobacteria bacterium]|jgi:flagellar motor switch protein FliG|nr:flagellar motor switch protein FliG [Gammaproteobacteria bacterium]
MADAAEATKNDQDSLVNEETRNELAILTRSERAAVILLLLGEEQAADIISYMSPREVQALGANMVSVADLSQEAVNIVLDDFISTIKKQTNLGLGTAEYVQAVFTKALGEDKAATVLGRIMPGSSSKGLDILRWMDARSIGEMVVEEHPQVIAIILSVLEYDVAADVLNFIPAEVRAEVIQRVASLETIHPSAMEELESVMMEQFSSNSSAKSSSFGGIKTAAKIMNFTKSELETSIITGVTGLDEELALKIQDNMFTFENLSGLDNRSIQVLMRNIETDLLMTALKAADEEVKDKFMDNMSQRAKVMFIDEMEAKGPIRITDVEDAQKVILRIARKLSDSGDIVLAGRGDDFV